MNPRGRLLLALLASGLAFFSVGHARAQPAQSAGDLVQFCADNASSRSAIRERAREERWWRLDREAMENLRAATRLAAEVEIGWLVDEEGLILTVSTDNERLAALGDPMAAGERALPVQACTVFATRADVDQIRREVESTVIFGEPVGPPTSVLDLQPVSAGQWVMRSGNGEVAYIYAEFGRAVAAIEVGRIVTDR
jgi:hypothetical protein